MCLQECYAVICGGAEETKTLLENRFDHIFYTGMFSLLSKTDLSPHLFQRVVFCCPGSQSVARCVLQAAAVHLTPVTLEMGGKCPCLIYGRLDMKAAAKRLVWAKFFNAGQSCVAPDYVLCTDEVKEMLLPFIKEALESFYGSEPQESPDYGRIVTDRHWSRLIELMKKSEGKVVIGGESVKETRYIGK